jgi:5-methylcytosine-specific restriction endonuclease McrA
MLAEWYYKGARTHSTEGAFLYTRLASQLPAVVGKEPSLMDASRPRCVSEQPQQHQGGLFAMLKHCGKCGRDLDTGAFCKDKKKTDGLGIYCKDCEKARVAVYRQMYPERVRATEVRQREEHREEKRARDAQYNAEHRDEILAWKARYRKEHREELAIKQRAYVAEHRKEIEAYRASHREEMRARQKAYRVEHPTKARAYRVENRERILAYNRTYYQAHLDLYWQQAVTRRARLHQSPIEKFTRAEIYKRDRGICHLCHKRVDPKRWDLDHLQPIARGGSHTRVNVAISHPKCNRQRSAYGPAQLRLSVIGE